MDNRDHPDDPEMRVSHETSYHLPAGERGAVGRSREERSTPFATPSHATPFLGPVSPREGPSSDTAMRDMRITRRWYRQTSSTKTDTRPPPRG